MATKRNRGRISKQRMGVNRKARKALKRGDAARARHLAGRSSFRGMASRYGHARKAGHVKRGDSWTANPKRKKPCGKRTRKNPVGASALLSAASPVLQRAGKKLGLVGSKRKTSVKFKKRKNPAGKTTGKTRRNPLDKAQEVYQRFHGRPSEQTVTITTPIHEHKYLSGIGELVELHIRSQAGYLLKLKNFKGAILAQNEKRTQLFVEGGDQKVDLKGFGIRGPIHELETLGELEQVWYYTVKDHLGADGGEAVYRHRLKKVRFRRRPTVIYDVVNQLITFAGGNYSIPDEGILD